MTVAKGLKILLAMRENAGRERQTNGESRLDLVGRLSQQALRGEGEEGNTEQEGQKRNQGPRRQEAKTAEEPK